MLIALVSFAGGGIVSVLVDHHSCRLAIAALLECHLGVHSFKEELSFTLRKDRELRLTRDLRVQSILFMGNLDNHIGASS